MASKLEKPRVSKAAPYPFGKKRKRGGRRPDPIIAWQRVLCNGERHAIGLTVRGELVFPNHTKEDLARATTLVEFGTTNCVCATTLYNWRLGRRQYIPELLARERMCWHAYGSNRGNGPPAFVGADPLDTLAFRLMQRRRRKRNLAAFQGKTLVTPADIEKHSSSPAGLLLDQVNLALVEAAERMGWTKASRQAGSSETIHNAEGVKRNRYPLKIRVAGRRSGIYLDMPDPPTSEGLKSWGGRALNLSGEYETHTITSAEYSDNPVPYCRVSFVGLRYDNTISVTLGNQHEWDLRLASDCIDFIVLNRLLNQQNNYLRLMRLRDLSLSMAKARNDIMQTLRAASERNNNKPPKRDEEEEEEENDEDIDTGVDGIVTHLGNNIEHAIQVRYCDTARSTCELTLTVKNLTTQASTLLVRAISEELTERLTRIGRSTERRGESEHRYPIPVGKDHEKYYLGTEPIDPREK